LDAVYLNNYNACLTAIRAALSGKPQRAQLADVVEHISNPFYTPKA
jgi:5,6,7,8-tetrahydromethanopterin hydro-lyase